MRLGRGHAETHPGHGPEPKSKGFHYNAAWRVALALLCLSAHRSWAGNFSVWPLEVTLSQGSAAELLTTELLTLRNESDEPLRFEVTVAQWDQSPAGEMLLKPTDDIVYFPALLAIPPREVRKIRVGTVARTGSMEKSYRLFVEQLPEPDRKPQPRSAQVRVRVLTKMGIPIFVQPHKLTRASEITGLTMAEGLLRFQIKNTGNIHFQVRKIRVAGFTDPGNPQFSKETSGWYILAGGVRDYEISIPAADCRRTRRIEITVATETGEIKESFSPPPDACGAPPVSAGTVSPPSGANRRAQPPSPSAARRNRQ